MLFAQTKQLPSIYHPHVRLNTFAGFFFVGVGFSVATRAANPRAIMLSVVFALLFAFSAINACQYEGHTKSHGETWVVTKPNSGGSWVMKCEMPSHNEYRVFLAGCVTPLRNNVLVNEHFTEGDFIYSCIKDNDGYVQLKSARRDGSRDPY